MRRGTWNKGRPNLNRGRRLPPEPLSDDEAQRLIDAPSRRSATGKRNAAILAVLLRCGMRCRELCDLDLRDLDAQAGTVRVRHGKGDRHRMLGVDPDTLRLIQLWLAVRPAGSTALFSTLASKRIQPSYLRSLLPRLAKRAGIDKRCHPHGMRHSFAAGLAARNVPLPVISQALGHRRSSVTSTYLDSIQPKLVLETMRRIAWGRA